ncbi:hypothetical protein JW824_06150, partial [bacterium]|nr:hypothetical protein [bacterium]
MGPSRKSAQGRRLLRRQGPVDGEKLVILIFTHRSLPFRTAWPGTWSRLLDGRRFGRAVLRF